MIYHGMDGMQVDKKLAELLDTGFFDDSDLRRYADTNGRIRFGELRDLFIACKCGKYALKYLITNGSLLPTWGAPAKYGDPDEAEELYRRCLENGTTWEEETGYKENKDVLY